jgi:large subunit ribosomal protein L10
MVGEKKDKQEIKEESKKVRKEENRGEKSEKTKGKNIKASVSKTKKETVKKLINNIKNKNTFMISSIKSLPSKQFQDIRKKLRDKAYIKVVKKRILQIAIDSCEVKELQDLKQYVQENSAVISSDLGTFELAAILAENKNPVKAKAGQTTEEDIYIEKGPTDLVPGPAISELGNLGIKVAVEEGKIAIKEGKTIVKQGQKINDDAAVVMAKLDIKPFEVGLEPIAAYDKKDNKIYTDIKINKKQTIKNIKTSAAKALGLAQKIVYYCKETIPYLISKAAIHEKIINSLKPSEESKPKKEGKTEKEPSEDKTEGEKKDEEKQEGENNTDQNKETKSKEE